MKNNIASHPIVLLYRSDGHSKRLLIPDELLPAQAVNVFIHHKDIPFRLNKKSVTLSKPVKRGTRIVIFFESKNQPDFPIISL